MKNLITGYYIPSRLIDASGNNISGHSIDIDVVLTMPEDKSLMSEHLDL